MTGFEDKERAEEAKYALDREQEFKVVARRNKLLGLWAAGLMGFDDAKAHAYAKDVVLSDFEEPGDEDVFRKVYADLQAAKVAVSDAELHQKMAALLGEAEKQLAAE